MDVLIIFMEKLAILIMNSNTKSKRKFFLTGYICNGKIAFVDDNHVLANMLRLSFGGEHRKI